MTRLPRITGKELLAALRRIGFDVIRVKGSHHFARHPDGRATVVPVHAGTTLGLGLLAKILSDVRIGIDELLDLL